MKAIVIGLVVFFLTQLAGVATIVFDDAHKPTNSVLEQNPVCELTSGLRGGFRELASLVGEEGHTVEVLSFPSMFTSEVLQGKCAVVINAPCKFGNCGSSYTVEEIALLYEYLLGSGNLLIMAEPFLRAPLSPMLSMMGMVMGNSICHPPKPCDLRTNGVQSHPRQWKCWQLKPLRSSDFREHTSSSAIWKRFHTS